MKATAKKIHSNTPTLFSSATLQPSGGSVPRAPFADHLMPLYDPPKSGEPYADGSVWFDTKRADEILLRMLHWFEKGLGHYQHNNVENAPQNALMPAVFSGKRAVQVALDGTFEEVPYAGEMKHGSLEHLKWLFPAVGSDRRQESWLVYRNHSLLYHAHPELYTLGHAQYMEQEQLEALLRSFGFGIPEDTSYYWPYQARTLFRCFDGNPIKLLDYCGGTVRGVQEFRKNWRKETGYPSLPGFGTKITSLLFLFYEELGKYPMPDDAFAVDLHVQRFFLQTGTLCLKQDVIAKALEERIRPYLCGFCARHNKNKVNLAHALWQNGAKLCDICPKAKGVDVLCPVEKDCSGSVETKNYTGQSRWRHPLVFRIKGKDRPFATYESGSLFENTA